MGRVQALVRRWGVVESKMILSPCLRVWRSKPSSTTSSPSRTSPNSRPGWCDKLAPEVAPPA